MDCYKRNTWQWVETISVHMMQYIIFHKHWQHIKLPHIIPFLAVGLSTRPGSGMLRTISPTEANTDHGQVTENTEGLETIQTVFHDLENLQQLFQLPK